MSKNLQSRILHLPASGPSDRSPLSADVYAIRGETAWWIFDVGACDEAANFINNLPCEAAVQSGAEQPNVVQSSVAQPLKKNIVISHFHRDHSFNLSRVKFDSLYVGRETYRHCDETLRAHPGVNIVEAPIVIEDGLQICVEPIPSSHAKGSLMLSVGDCPAGVSDAAKDGEQCSDAAKICGFLGDSTYPAVGHGKPDSYNVQLLFEQIKFLRQSCVTHFYMSHRRFVPKEKDSIIQLLDGFYSQREPNKNIIEISQF